MRKKIGNTERPELYNIIFNIIIQYNIIDFDKHKRIANAIGFTFSYLMYEIIEDYGITS